MQVKSPTSSSDVQCDSCKHFCFLAHALLGKRSVSCLRCALARERRLGPGTEIICNHKLARYQRMAADVELDIRAGKVPSSTLRMEGLTEGAHWSKHAGETPHQFARCLFLVPFCARCYQVAG